MTPKKPSGKKPEKKTVKKTDMKAGEKTSLSTITAARKDTIVGTVHERARALKVAPAAAMKEGVKSTKLWLETQPEVESVIQSGDADLTVKFRDGTQVGMLLNRKNLFGGGAGSTDPDEPVPDVHVRTLNAPDKGDPHPISLRACVIDTLYDDWPGKTMPNNVVKTLKNAGYVVDLIAGTNANLKFFSTLDENEYGVVFLMTHGGMMNVGGDSKLHMMARPFFKTFPPASGYDGVNVFSVDTTCETQGWAYVYAYNNLFVNKYNNKKYFPNSLFHLLVCEGAHADAQNDMIPSYLDRGVGCYTGWTHSASGLHGIPAAQQFFQVLCDSAANPANTVTKAIAAITASGHSPDPGTGAVLVARGPGSMQIIGCNIVTEASQIVIADAGGKTIRKGFHDILDAMEYAENQINGGKHAVLKITQTVRLEKIAW
jgi:hypothetical protein